MIKIKEKIQFNKIENRMNYIEGKNNLEKFNLKNKSKNLDFLLSERFLWMNNFIKYNDFGLEVGSGVGYAKHYIKNKNFKISDISSDKHLDFKNVDAQKTNFPDNHFNFVIASNMVHHVPYPMKFFREMYRILKKDGNLIIFEPYCSVALQIVTILMKHEGFDFTVNPWETKNPKSSETDAWHGNIAVSNLIFDDKTKFKHNLGDLFEIHYEKLTECLIFLNSGGVTSKTLYIPMNYFFLKIINMIDKTLIKIMPSIFCLGRRIVLKKI